MRKKRKAVILEDTAPGLRPVSLVVLSGAVILGGMIVFNAFFGQHPDEQMALGNLEIPEGATTHASVTVPGKSSRVVTLKYDELVEDIQRELATAGLFQGPVDGVNGPRTREAIQRYQTANQLDATGEVSPGLLDHMRYTRTLTKAAATTGSITQAMTDETGTQAQSPVTASTVADGDATEASPELKRVQQRLAKLGYETGPASGYMDDSTRSAILTFEMDNGLAMDGAVSRELIAAITKAVALQASR